MADIYQKLSGNLTACAHNGSGHRSMAQVNNMMIAWPLVEKYKLAMAKYMLSSQIPRKMILICIIVIVSGIINLSKYIVSH